MGAGTGTPVSTIVSGNLGDNSLPIAKRILGISGITQDSDILDFISGAVSVVDLTLGAGLAVAVTGSEYALTPDSEDTDGIWAVLALGGVYYYKQDEFDDELKELNGLTTISDQVQSFSRAENIRALRDGVTRAESNFKAALMKYARSSTLTTSYSYEEMETREDATETALGIDT